MTKREIIYITLATGFIASLAALYVGYLIAQKQLNQTLNSNPLLKIFAPNS